MPDIDTFLVIHYDSSIRAEEQQPAFVDSSGFCRCSHSGKTFGFVSYSSLNPEEPLEDWQRIAANLSELSESSLQSSSAVAFSHSLKAQHEELAAFVDRNTRWHFDYSSVDRHYTQFWQELRSADHCCEAVDRLAYWTAYLLQHQVADPIRRIKHRALNRFGPLAMDLYRLKELWSAKRFQAAKAHWLELRQQWRGTPPESVSPRSEVARLWYLLANGHFDWQASYLAPPREVALIPVNGEQLCLYDCLRRMAGAQVTKLKAWQELLRLVQLQVRADTFRPAMGNGIHTFATALEQLVNQEDAPDPEMIIDGFRSNTPLTTAIDQYREWFLQLNDTFEELKQWAGKSLSSVNETTEKS